MTSETAISRNGTNPAGASNVLGSREAWRARKGKSRPIVPVAVPELSEPGEPPMVVLMQAMSGTRKESWGLRRLADEHYEPDEELRKQYDRQKTWGEMLQGTKVSLVAQSVVDEHGQLIFDEEGIAELGDENAAALERMNAKAIQLNGLPRAAIPDYLLDWLVAEEVLADAQHSLPIETRVKNTRADRTDSSSST